MRLAERRADRFVHLRDRQHRFPARIPQRQPLQQPQQRGLVQRLALAFQQRLQRLRVPLQPRRQHRAIGIRPLLRVAHQPPRPLLRRQLRPRRRWPPVRTPQWIRHPRRRRTRHWPQDIAQQLVVLVLHPRARRRWSHHLTLRPAASRRRECHGHHHHPTCDPSVPAHLLLLGDPPPDCFSILPHALTGAVHPQGSRRTWT